MFNEGSADDQIKQDLQAVAEDVAASVLRQSTASSDLHGRDMSSQEDVDDVDDLNKTKALVILFTCSSLCLSPVL